MRHYLRIGIDVSNKFQSDTFKILAQYGEPTYIPREICAHVHTGHPWGCIAFTVSGLPTTHRQSHPGTPGQSSALPVLLGATSEAPNKDELFRKDCEPPPQLSTCFLIHA